MPAKNPRVSVTLTDTQMATVQRLARRARVSCSWVVNHALAEFLEKNADRREPLPILKGTQP